MGGERLGQCFDNHEFVLKQEFNSYSLGNENKAENAKQLQEVFAKAGLLEEELSADEVHSESHYGRT